MQRAPSNYLHSPDQSKPTLTPSRCSTKLGQDNPGPIHSQHTKRPVGGSCGTSLEWCVARGALTNDEDYNKCKNTCVNARTKQETHA